MQLCWWPRDHNIKPHPCVNAKQYIWVVGGYFNMQFHEKCYKKKFNLISWQITLEYSGDRALYERAKNLRVLEILIELIKNLQVQNRVEQLLFLSI